MQSHHHDYIRIAFRVDNHVCTQIKYYFGAKLPYDPAALLPTLSPIRYRIVPMVATADVVSIFAGGVSTL